MEMINSLINAIDNLRRDDSHDAVRQCKDALNAIFGGKSTCERFIYTINIDKLPFGCIAMPKISGQEVNELVLSGDPIRIAKYDLELDSKLFDYGLTSKMIAEVILYNVYHLTNDTTPSVRFREALDIYLADNDTQLSIKNSVQYQSILALGLCDTLIQFTNCMYLETDIISDPLLEQLGLTDFDDALNKMFAKIPGCETSMLRKPRLSTLDWCLRLYNDVEKERIPALRLMDKMKDITASALYTQKFNNVIQSLNRIDTDSIVNEAVQQLVSEGKKKGSLFSQIKYAGLRGIEEDLYEFMIRAKNAETEEEVMYALKQINVRIAILDDYLRNEDISDAERARWQGVLDKYIAIRDQIAAKKVYNKKNYGIFIDYNKLDQMDEDHDSEEGY